MYLKNQIRYKLYTIFIALIFISSSSMVLAEVSYLFPWDAPNSWYYTGGPHGWGNTTGGSGLDFAPGNTSEILAVETGEVYYSGWNDWGSGNNLNIRIRHGNGWETWYLHLSSSLFGDSGNLSQPVNVSRGQHIAQVGKTGAIATHIHIELVYNGQHIAWDGKVINNWSVHSNCAGYSGPATCQALNYNGYIENLSSHEQKIPKSPASVSQLVKSDNSRGASPNIWQAEYFDREQNWVNPSCKTENFSGPVLNKNWGSSGPCNKVDGFSARFIGTFDFTSANYAFHINHDDGAQLFLDGRNIWDNSASSNGLSTICSVASETLSGRHTLELKFWESSSDAHIYLDWSTDVTPCQIQNNAVTIFDNPTYTGTQYGWHDAGRFSLPDYLDNKVSSILIETGWSVRVFEQGNWKSVSRCFDSSDSDFGDDVFANGVSVDNSVSSIEIYNKETCPPPGDGNSDGVVDGIDYVIWLNHYNTSTNNGPAEGDFNYDGIADGIDYVIWLNNYGK